MAEPVEPVATVNSATTESAESTVETAPVKTPYRKTASPVLRTAENASRAAVVKKWTNLRVEAAPAKRVSVKPTPCVAT